MQAESSKQNVKGAPETLEMRFQKGNVGLGLNQRPMFQGLLHLGRGRRDQGRGHPHTGLRVHSCRLPVLLSSTHVSHSPPNPPGDEAKLGIDSDTFLPPVPSRPAHQPIPIDGFTFQLRQELDQLPTSSTNGPSIHHLPH